MKKTIFSSVGLFVLFAILASIVGGCLLMNAMHWGPWAFSDSAAYVSGARNFSAGKGFIIINSNNSTTPVTEFPPLYAVFLSLFLGTDGDPNAVIRWINIALFVAFLWIFGLTIFVNLHNNLLAFFGMLFCVCSPVLMEIFSGVMSETLFFPLLYAVILLAILSLRSQNRSVFILLTVFSCLLPITRYAGTLFVAAIAVLIFFLYPASRREKLLHAGSYLIISLLPIGLWFYRLYHSFNKVGGKHFKINLAFFQNLWESLKTEMNVLKTWLPYFGIYENPVFDKILVSAAIVLLTGLFAFCVFHLRKKNPKNLHTEAINQLFIFSVVNLCAYLLFIALTHSITIPQIDIINRMLAPVLPMMIAFVLCALDLLFLQNRKALLILTTLVLLVVLRYNSYQTWSFAQEMKTNGHGYSARQYQQSGLVDQIQALPENQRMVSNSAGFVLYYTNRFPIQIDQFANRTYGTTNGYGEKSFREKGAALILLYPDFRNYYGDAASQLLDTITHGLDVQFQDEVGGIYYYPLNSPTLP